MQAPEKDSEFELILGFSDDGGLSDLARRNRGIVVKAYRAQLAGDIEAWWSIFDPAVRFHEADSLPYGGVYEGLAATRAGCDAMFANWRKLHIYIEELAAAGDIVIAYVQMTATSRATGKSFSFPVAELFRMRDGKVVEWRPIYWDTHLARAVSDAA